MEFLQGVVQLVQNPPSVCIDSSNSDVAFNITGGIILGIGLGALAVLNQLNYVRGPYVTGDWRAIHYATTKAIAPVVIFGSGILGGLFGAMGYVVRRMI